MNNKDFITFLAEKIDISVSEAQKMVSLLSSVFIDSVDEESVVTIQGFGSFEFKKKLERIVINPTSKQRMLIPPKIVLNFKPSTKLKEKYNR